MKKKYYILLGILCLLIITNPSITAFKAYRGSNTYQGLYRPVNLFIFSEYKDRSYEYVGVFGNFFKMPRTTTTYSHADSISMGWIDTDKKYDEFGILIRKR